MAKDWYELTRLTRGAPAIVERVRLVDSDIAIEGSFELPPLARLSADDQVFVMAFVRAHGSIKEMEQYYAASDIYVHPTFYDPCSLTVLEALASGLPVITSRFNGAADVITSNKGGKILEDPADVKDLANSIAFYFDEGRRNKARDVARRWMEKYSPAYNVEQILRVYYEVAGRRPGLEENHEDSESV